MAKICVCDVCKHEGKIVVSKYRAGFKAPWKIDVCETHSKTYPKNKADFIMFQYEISGMPISREDAERLSKTP